MKESFKKLEINNYTLTIDFPPFFQNENPLFNHTKPN